MAACSASLCSVSFFADVMMVSSIGSDGDGAISVSSSSSIKGGMPSVLRSSNDGMTRVSVSPTVGMIVSRSSSSSSSSRSIKASFVVSVS